MTISEEDFHALGTLATKRVQDACNSVGQMLEDSEQAINLLLNVIYSMCNSAAGLMHDNVVDQDGNKPPIEECFAEVLAMLARANGLSVSVLDLDEALERGLVRQRTPDA